MAEGGKFYGGAYAAKMAVKGEAGPTGVDVGQPMGKVDLILDAKDELNYDKASQWVAWLGYEHNHKKWPKVQLHHTRFRENSGNGTSSFGPASVEIDSRLAVDATDIVFYYTLLDAPTKIDLGMGSRRLSVDFKVDATINFPPNPPVLPPGMPEFPEEPQDVSAHKKTTQHMPILYGSLYHDLPLKGTYVSAASVFSKYKDRKLYHSRLAVGWVSDYYLGIEAGYSHQLHRFSADDSVTVDIKLGGPYIAALLRF